ncbi:MAG: class I SAM-dependent methyltransferase [Chloroflexota bacterium]
MDREPYTSADFYRLHSARYADVAHAFGQSVYLTSSHDWLKHDWDLLRRAEALAPGLRALDAGCGAGARDVYKLWCDGYEVFGIDAVEENITVARRMHPEIADRLSVADLRQPLPYPAEEFDLVLCNAVIQHIPREDTFAITLPELVRVLRRGGVLQLMFKRGKGILTLQDRDYGVERSFLLYEEDAILSSLDALGLEPVDTPEAPGTVLYFTDTKLAPHCAVHGRRQL